MSASHRKWQIGLATDPGIKRRGRPNEDAVGVYQSRFNPRPPLIVIADGMGGYLGGAVASKSVVESFKKAYKSSPAGMRIADLLASLVKAAHAELIKLAQRDASLEKMGSTVVAAILGSDQFGLVHVGDSRAYLLRGQALQQLTVDQSRRAELQQAGLSEAEIREHPQRTFLTMSLSPQRQEVQPIVTEESACEGDVLILCSDGIWNTLSAEEIAAILADLDPQPAAEKLIQSANTSHALDNVSVVVARLGRRIQVDDDTNN